MAKFGANSEQMGYGAEDYAGKPVIGVINTWSDLSACHSHFRHARSQREHADSKIHRDGFEDLVRIHAQQEPCAVASATGRCTAEVAECPPALPRLARDLTSFAQLGWDGSSGAR